MDHQPTPTHLAVDALGNCMHWLLVFSKSTSKRHKDSQRVLHQLLHEHCVQVNL